MSEAAIGLTIHDIIFVNIPGMTAQLLGAFLQECGTLRLVGQAQTDTELQFLLHREKPHVGLVYFRRGRENTNGMVTLQLIKALAPQLRPIILGHDLTNEDETALFHEGARGLLSEADATLSTLIKCVCSVAAGQVWANSRQLEHLLASLSRSRPPRITNVLGAAILSRREEEVLHLLSEGMSNRELAVTLGLSEHTVKNHLFRIFDKLGVSNRMEAILYAISRRESHIGSTVPGLIQRSALGSNKTAPENDKPMSRSSYSAMAAITENPSLAL
jgi:DNA-binding NarL/FixJ family response regulator